MCRVLINYIITPSNNNPQENDDNPAVFLNRDKLKSWINKPSKSDD